MLRLLSLPRLVHVQYTFVLVHYILVQTVLSAPYLAIRNFTNSHLNILPDGPSAIRLHRLNITVLGYAPGISYHVPNTMTTLYFHLGFPCKDAGMRSTINSARTYCEQQLGRGGDRPLPRSEEPFHEDLGYGAAIDVVSSRPDHRLTWGILKDAMEGLWDFLVTQGRYVECDFDIYHGELDLMGRGTINEAPETEIARRSRKRKKEMGNSLGTTFDYLHNDNAKGQATS